MLSKKDLSAKSKKFFEDAFDVPESVVSVVYQPVNETLFITNITVQAGCALPQPFYSGICINATWISSGEVTVSREDIIASSTPAIHQGDLVLQSKMTLESSFSVENTLLVQSTNVTVGGGSLQTKNFIMESSSLTITGLSSINSAENISMSSSVLILGTSQTISTTGCIHINQSTLNIDTDQVVTGKEYTLLQYSCVDGSDQLDMRTSASSKCALSNKHWSAESLIVTFACDDSVVTKDIIPIVVPVVLGAVAVAGVVIFLNWRRRDKIARNSLRSRLGGTLP